MSFVQDVVNDLHRLALRWFSRRCAWTYHDEDEFGTLNRTSRLPRHAMANGEVDFFNDTGGYGFISTDDADEDVFFHMEDVGGPDLEEGQEIEFDIEKAEKGPRATNVTRL